MECYAKTPARIGDELFSIPIYQRLFAWTKDEIEQLLNDLLAQYRKDKDKHYYIGLLTATANNELVDGQQRFTVAMLLGIAMREWYAEWRKFLMHSSNKRLSFSARPNDSKYLDSLISGEDDNVSPNEYMQDGLNTIKSYLGRLSCDDAADFCKYVYEHLAFFIQVLPEGYSGRMLNKYFESMNSTGRNLENHEILKVELIEMADVSSDTKEYDRLVYLWNKAGRMNQTVMPINSDDYKSIIEKIKNDDSSVCILPDETNENEHSRSILNVITDGVSTSYSKDNKRSSTMRSFLKFTDFLLLVLYMTLEDKGVYIPNKSEFFKPENLRSTFKLYAEHYSPKTFIEDLYIYRIILDWAIIRVDDSYDYDLALTTNEQSRLQQYEAMLYVGTSRDTYYQWIPGILRYVKTYGDDENQIFAELKRIDNAVNPFSITDNNSSRPLRLSDFRYRNFKRYYYRRLDYFLWEKIVHDGSIEGLLPEEISNAERNELKSAVAAYKFHSYNSEEHLYPQHDEKQADEHRWKTADGQKDEDALNSFGNLALISTPFNSSQNDDALNRKFGSIRDQILQKKIESIKLAIMYYSAKGKAENWTAGPEGVSTIHGELMFRFLENSYKQA